MNRVYLTGKLLKKEFRKVSENKWLCDFVINTADDEGENILMATTFETKSMKALKYANKGAYVEIEGKLMSRPYEKGGTTYYNPQIRATTVKVLTTPANNAADEDDEDEEIEEKPKQKVKPKKEARRSADDDDMPF